MLPSLEARYDFLRRTSSCCPRRPESSLNARIGHKAVVCSLSASYISTFVGYPVSPPNRGLLLVNSRCSAQLDSVKSRLQTIKTPVNIGHLIKLVYREEGLKGFYRGLWIPLLTISFVRAYAFLS